MPLDPDQQRQFAVDVVRTLRAGGFEAYWAGGCVRDQLLARTPKDYDVATSARPEEIRQMFGTRRTLAVGAAFGVIAVLGPKPAGQIEVATFRQDATYSDGRHPDAVTYSTPQADAQRRDFTINGLFFDPMEQRVIDFVGGQEDLKLHVLRAIGQPLERFAEDKLRLLRAVRFATTLDFELETETRRAIQAMADQVTVVSAERIAAEMRAMLTSPRRGAAMQLLMDVGLLQVILPELWPNAVQASIPPREFGESLKVLDRLTEPGFPLPLAVLLRTNVDGPGSVAIGRRWKLANREIDRTRWLLEHQGEVLAAPGQLWSKVQPLLIHDGAADLIALDEATALETSQDKSGVDACREKLKMAPHELNPSPLLTGDDLIKHGVPRGKLYQRLLDAVRAAQLDGQISTPAEALELVDRLRNE